MHEKYHRYKRYDDDFKRNASTFWRLPAARSPNKTLERWRHQMRGRNRKPLGKQAPPPDPRELELKQLGK